MAYRNGTYIAFHAKGTSYPIESDIKYFNLLKAWNIRENSNFNFVDSHEKAASVRDESKKETLKRTLVTRLSNSKNMILILTADTQEDKDWIPFEIEQAIDRCKIPIIATYPGCGRILNPGALVDLWPLALHKRIITQEAHVIHIPFNEKTLIDAVGQFSYEKYPKGGGLGFYSEETYKQWGI